MARSKVSWPGSPCTFAAIVLQGILLLLAGCASPSGGAQATPASLAGTAIATPRETATAAVRPNQTPIATGYPRICGDTAPRVEQVARISVDYLASPALAWSPDGQWLAVGDFSGFSLYETRTFDLVHTVRTDTLVSDIVFSPHSMLVAVASFGNSDIRLFDVKTGQEKAVLRGHSEGVFSLAFSPDGRLLASGSGDNTVRLWEVASGREARVLYGHTSAARGLAFSPNGALLLSGGLDGTVRLWGIETGRQVLVVERQEVLVSAVAFSPDGASLAVATCTKPVQGDDTFPAGEVILWDARRGQRRLGGHSGGVLGVAFSPDGTLLASISVDGTTRLWGVGSGKELKVLQEQPGYAVDVAFSPDGALLATLSPGAETLRLWGLPGK